MFTSGKPYMRTCLGHYSTLKRNHPVILKNIIEQSCVFVGGGMQNQENVFSRPPAGKRVLMASHVGKKVNIEM